MKPVTRRTSDRLVGLTDEEIDQLPYEELVRRAAADMSIRIEEARESPLGLYRLLFTDDKRQPIVIKFFHHEWNELVLNTRMFVVCASRELSKTSYMLAAAAWIIGRNPDIRIKWLSADDDTATKRLAVIHALLDHPLYQQVFPGIRKLTGKESKDEKRPNSATVLNVKRNILTPEATVEAAGIMVSGVGGRADVLICDDVVSESNALTNPSLRPKVISKFLSDWLSTLVADGRVWYIGSPWHKEDLLAYLKEKSGWTYRQYNHGKPGDIYHSIFPERWPRDALIERRRVLGPLHYARAYLCEPLREGTVAVSPRALGTYSKAELTPTELYNAAVIVSMDPSSGKELDKGKLDYTGVVIFLFVTDDDDPTLFKLFVVDAFQVKLPHVVQARLAWQLVVQWQAQYLLIEAKGMQALHAWLEEQQREDPTLPMVQIEPISGGNLGKGQRLMRISPLMDRPDGERRLVYFHPQAVTPHPEPYALEVNGIPYEALKDLRSQLLGFPTQHDDILDAYTQGAFWIHETLVDKSSSTSRPDPSGNAGVCVLTL